MDNCDLTPGSADRGNEFPRSPIDGDPAARSDVDNHPPQSDRGNKFPRSPINNDLPRSYVAPQGTSSEPVAPQGASSGTLATQGVSSSTVASAGVSSGIELSVVVPFFNEAAIVHKFYERLSMVLHGTGRACEIILVDDGSTDGTAGVLEQIALADERVTVVELRRNFGQTTALQAGIDHAAGEVILTMDGDLQHDPYEIPFFLAKIDEGYQVVSGWRVRRRDNLLMRRLPSRAANWLLARVSSVELHDFGTTFKAYRRDILKSVHLYGDMHRFIPAMCARLGARICEVPIKNVRRAAGRSNYGIGRTFRVALDLITVRFICSYFTRPLHFFGKWGLVSMAAGGAILG